MHVADRGSGDPFCCVALGLTLALFVPRVVTDDSDDALAPDDAAFVAHRLDARLDLHLNYSSRITCTGR